MPKLFVTKTIEINSSASKVWDILIKPDYTSKWAYEFSSGGPRFHIESDWQLGSQVLWKSEEGNIIVEGKVTAYKLNKLLRFTVFDVRSENKFPVTKEDGITYQLKEKNGITVLHIMQGDFSVVPNGEKYFTMTEKIWNRVLPKVKELAENK